MAALHVALRVDVGGDRRPRPRPRARRRRAPRPFVKTNPNTGLTARLADRCISILAPLAVGSRPSPSRHGRVAGGFAAPLRRTTRSRRACRPAPRARRAGRRRSGAAAPTMRGRSRRRARAPAPAPSTIDCASASTARRRSRRAAATRRVAAEVACRAPTLQLPSEYSGIGGSAASSAAGDAAMSPGYAAPRGAATGRRPTRRRSAPRSRRRASRRPAAPAAEPRLGHLRAPVSAAADGAARAAGFVRHGAARGPAPRLALALQLGDTRTSAEAGASRMCP